MNEQQEIQRREQEDFYLKKITDLEKGIDDAKATVQEQLGHLEEVLKEEKVTKKRMEQWFQSRLTSLEHYANELKANPQDEKKLNHLADKIKRLKTKKPWNPQKNLKLMLDEALFDKKGNKSDKVNSSGTSTPFSCCVYIFSAAPSEDNTINQAFIGSEDNSLSVVQNSMLNDLNTNISQSLNKGEQEEIDAIARKLRDKNLSLTEKEKIFCGVLRSNVPDENLLHVELEDILAAGNDNTENDSLSLDSLQLDIRQDPELANDSRGFNHPIRLGEIRDTELEDAVSSIVLGSNQKASAILDDSFSSKPIDGKIFGFDLNRKSDKDIQGGDRLEGKEFELGKILSRISISDPEVSQMLLESLNKGPLSVKGGGQNVKLGNVLDKVQRLHSDKSVVDMDFSSFDKKRDGTNKKLFEKMDVSDSFFGEEFKSLLERVIGDESNISEIHHRERPKKEVQEEENLLKEEIAKAGQQRVETSKENISDNDLKISPSAEQKNAVAQQQEQSNVNNPSTQRSSGVPVLNMERLKNKGQKGESVLGAENPFIGKNLDQDRVVDNFEEELGNKKTEKNSQVQSLMPPNELKTPPKINSKRFDENQSTNNHFKKVNYAKPRPPSNPRRSMDFRSGVSLFDEENKGATQHNSFENYPNHENGSPGKTDLMTKNASEGNFFDMGSPGHTAAEDDEHNRRDKKIEFKNNRNVRSLTIESRTMLKLQTHFQTPLLGNSSHMYLGSGLDISPPRKKGSDSPFIRSYSIYNNPQFAYMVQPHSSLAAFQRAPFNMIGEDMTPQNLNDLFAKGDPKQPPKILPYEKSRNYPTPNLNPGQQYHRRVPTEQLNSATYQKYDNINSEDSNSEKISKESKKELKPRSPTKRGRTSQEKPQNILINDGATQFRAKKFASRKV